MRQTPGAEMMRGSKASPILSLCIRWRGDMLIVLSLVFYCSIARGKCSVKLNAVLAVGTFSLEAQRIKADGERQPAKLHQAG